MSTDSEIATTPRRSPRRIAGWVLTVLLAALFIASATGKLSAAPPVVEMFAKWGLTDQRVLIGTGELVSAVVLLVPITHILGVLLLSAYLGGAILVHMAHAEPYIFPSAFLILLWISAALRRPDLFIARK